jgi:hypothetical protein
MRDGSRQAAGGSLFGGAFGEGWGLGEGTIGNPKKINIKDLGEGMGHGGYPQ